MTQKQQEQLQDDQLFQIIFQEKPAKILLKIHETQNKLHRNKKPNIAEIKRQIDITHKHSVQVISKLSPHLVNTKKEGRSKRLSLTPRGEEAVRKIRELQQTLGKGETA